MKFTLKILINLIFIGKVYNFDFVAKINQKYILPVDNNITPEHFKDIKKIQEISFVNVGDRILQPSLTISGFSDLNKLIIENQSLSDAPTFQNLEIGKLSLGGNKIQIIRNTTFTNVSLGHYLSLHSNQIFSIDDQTFPLLDGIILNCNELTTFKSSWFKVPERLRTIYMRNNKIETLDKDAFKDVKNLWHLILSSNQIKQLPDGIFQYSNTHTLDLSDNLLYGLKSTWFSKPNVTINTFKIEFNRLSFLREDFMSKVKVVYAHFSGNPWLCPCYNLIKKWMKQTVVYESVPDEYKNGLPVCIYGLDVYQSQFCSMQINEELYVSYISETDVRYNMLPCANLY